MALSRLLARPLLASYFIANGANDIAHTPEVAAKAAPVTDRMAPAVETAAQGRVPVPSEPETWVRVAGALQVAAGLSLAAGKAPRLSAAVLGTTLIPSTVARHRFWEESDKSRRANELVHFIKNAAIGGGLLLAALDTEGRPGIAWRTRHATQHVAHAAHDARRDAALAGTRAVNRAGVAGGKVVGKRAAKRLLKH
ncbi:MAG: DoxX family protein [Nocardioidaceae bacterium]|nr:DoxX family protein [Nocardioidaceae bacterium]MCL2612727.1 DoxX family protein [Nocardioidaceae bacterium]